jgi:hypothetical protein
MENGLKVVQIRLKFSEVDSSYAINMVHVNILSLYIYVPAIVLAISGLTSIYVTDSHICVNLWVFYSLANTH